MAVSGSQGRAAAGRRSLELGVLGGRLVREVVDAVPDQVGADAGRAEEDGDQEEIDESPPHLSNLAAPWDGMDCSGWPAAGFGDQRHWPAASLACSRGADR